MLFGDFPRLQDAKRWARDNERACQDIIEVEYFDNKLDGWRATEWVEGLPARNLLIHEKRQTKGNLAGKNVVFDTVFKTIQKQDLHEIWIHQLKILC